MINISFRGSIPALITPFDEHQAIDYAGLSELIEWHIEQQSDGLVIAGTTGESATLSVEDQIQLIKRSVEIANHRIPIIAGTGANATQEAIELTQCAKEAGVDACLLVVPYYNKPEQEGLYQHFAAVAKMVDIPQILYNVPSRTCCDLLPETVVRLATIKNIVGIKDASGDMQRLSQTKLAVDERFVFLSGDDKTACEFILKGGSGGITVTGNIAPNAVRNMYHLALEGRSEEALKIDCQLQGLHTALFCQSSPIPLKWALSEQRLCRNVLRLPLTPLAEQFYPVVNAAVEQAGLPISHHQTKNTDE